ncbi:MAG: hypothetical protein ACLGI6_23480, partial [Gammaproteobacteria bacterium]
WERECRQARDGGLADVARTVLARGQQIDPPATWSERDVVERALAALGESRASWSRSDCTRAISDALPAHLDVPPADVRELLEGLTDRALAHAVRLDVAEGADVVMVKPALPYLDVLAAVAADVDVPVWAYQVSGEYAMVEAAARAGWVDREERLLAALRHRPVLADPLRGLEARHADVERLRQIVLNLLSNAVKFTSPGGHIVMEWDAD